MPANKAIHYLKKLTGPVAGGLESMNESTGSPLSKEDIKIRQDKSCKRLDDFVKHFARNDKALKKEAKELVRKSGEPLRAVAALDHKFFDRNPESISLLEVIVQTDGSRPSFLIKNGKLDFENNPPGEWENPLLQSATRLKHAIACTGRINVGLKYFGTGFLVEKNHIVTNKHVLQSIATEDSPGN